MFGMVGCPVGEAMVEVDLGAAKKVDILLVEDNPADVYMFKVVLKELDVEVELMVATNGLDAWQHLERYASHQEEMPDVMVLDLNLPGLNGRQILERVRANPELFGIPTCIFTSARSEEGIVNEFPPLRLRFEAKTADFDELREIIGRVIDFSSAPN